ncbi:MAG: squalene synthase HpnC [Phycisphaerales bacterium]
MTSAVQQLAALRAGVDGTADAPPMDEAAARDWCRRLATGHYENFSVLSSLVPVALRDDFAAVYAFCRCADDLGDEVGDPAERPALLAQWRAQLQACYAGQPRHPVFVALAPVVRRHGLPIDPFDALIRAFEQDQHCNRYQSWEQLVDYCTRSADPVGRLVLGLFGLASPERVAMSDRVCTALQIANHLQDVRRDLLERDRIYLPAEATAAIPDFEERLRRSAQLGHACDREFLEQYRAAVRPLVRRTWELFAEGRPLLPTLTPQARPVVRLFVEGGESVLVGIERWNYETCLHRPTVGRARKLQLVARAWWGANAPAWVPAALGGPR